MPELKSRARARRGYLLMEVMIAGAMTAVIAAGVLNLILDARLRRIAAARDVVANQLVLDKLEELRNGPFPSPHAEVTEVVNGYTRQWKVVDPGAESLSFTSVVGPTATVASITLQCRDVTVTVKYLSNAFANPVRTTSATTRIYQ